MKWRLHISDPERGFFPSADGCYDQFWNQGRFLAEPALSQGVPHLSYLLATEVPPYICFEPVSCLSYVMPLSSCIGGDREESSQFTFSLAFMALSLLQYPWLRFLFYRPVFSIIPFMAASLYQ